MAMVVGDMLYAMGISLFLSVDETAERKQAALEFLTQAAVFTACGEMREILDTMEPLERMTAEGIAETCRLKTAYYSFACPLVTGALLAGAAGSDRDALLSYGLSIGLAFQIQDDALDLLDGHARDGHDGDLADLRDGTRTLPLWHAFNHAERRDRARLSAILDGGKPSRRDLETARGIIVRLGGVDYARDEVKCRLDEGRRALDSLRMDAAVRETLWRHTLDMLNAADKTTQQKEAIQ
jgi:geranylgeranyl pyrophosphate synthase